MHQLCTEPRTRPSVRDRVLEQAETARRRYGPVINASVIFRILQDREVVRHPVRLRFDCEALEYGEFAHAEPIGDYPGAGFCLYIDPTFEHRPDVWPLLIAYHIPFINDAAIATHDDCELFGATLLAMHPEDYYESLCELADSISAPTLCHS
ncbi:MAG: hypothetical protein JSR77_18170 [Planctomycetes bacterium]|nr:hypothetical protein [Planctomycetota bacterium]